MISFFVCSVNLLLKTSFSEIEIRYKNLKLSKRWRQIFSHKNNYSQRIFQYLFCLRTERTSIFKKLKKMWPFTFKFKCPAIRALIYFWPFFSGHIMTKIRLFIGKKKRRWFNFIIIVSFFSPSSSVISLLSKINIASFSFQLSLNM